MHFAGEMHSLLGRIKVINERMDLIRATVPEAFDEDHD